MNRKRPRDEKTPSTRCAIYTRKSSEEGLSQEFNSLDAQRESAEAYIASQKNEGWLCLPDRYDDGGFSGGNMERPALARLQADIRAGKVDCVVVYKVDRLSRSLLDFSKMMETFDKHHISFVSVTQQFNTTHSMGRLTLNILLSFAQFEREIIGERIRDKIAATRRKGKWAGGLPVLGYDVDRSGTRSKLVINAAEAARVRKIFELYLQMGTILPTVQELVRRGWQTKRWQSRAGRVLGGKPYNRCSLYMTLTNPIYLGKSRHKGELFDGEHEAIVPVDLFTKVQDQLRRHGRSGQHLRNQYGALLKGLLRCKACDRAMVHTFSKRGNKCWRYYVCSHALKSGRDCCPSGMLPVREIEALVVDQVRCIAHDPALLSDVLAKAREEIDSAFKDLKVERSDLGQELARLHAQIHQMAAMGPAGSAAAGCLADLTDRAGQVERRITELDLKRADLTKERIEESDLTVAFADWDDVWGRLTPREQEKLLALLVQRVEYDAQGGSVAVTFHPAGIKALAENPIEQTQETPA